MDLQIGKIMVIVCIALAILFIIKVIFELSKKKSGSSGKTNKKSNFFSFKKFTAAKPLGNPVGDGADELVAGYFANETQSGCLGKKPRFTDAEYDQYVLNKINEFLSEEKALQTIGIDESQVSEVAPVAFKGFECEDDYLSRYGLDGILRTSQYSISKIFFSDNQIFVYRVFFDFIKKSTTVSTREYFYKDITTFSCTSSIKEYKEYKERKGCLNKGTDISWGKSQATRFSIIVPGDTFSCSVAGVSEIEKTVQGMRQKLREKNANR